MVVEPILAPAALQHHPVIIRLLTHTVQTVTEKTGPGIFAIKSELIEQHR